MQPSLTSIPLPSRLVPDWFHLIDVGLNLQDPVFTGLYHGRRKHPSDFKEILSRASAYGVRNWMITGGSLKESQEAVAMARQTGSCCTVGCHPCRARELVNGPELNRTYLHQLCTLIEESRDVVAAYGECGLDYDRLNWCSAEDQRIAFREQLLIAKHLGLPLFLHVRQASEDFLQILGETLGTFREGNKTKIALPATGGLVHSFTGTLAELDAYVDAGLYISINGCSLKTSLNCAVASHIPIDKLLIETDSPWCEVRPTHVSWKILEELSQKHSQGTYYGFIDFPTVSSSLDTVNTFKAKKGRAPPALTDPAGLLPRNVRDPSRFELNQLVRGRNEPCSLILILLVLYELQQNGSNKLKTISNLFEQVQVKPPTSETTLRVFVEQIESNSRHLFPLLDREKMKEKRES